MADAQSKKILIVLTSHDRLGETGEKTGLWLEELAAPYYALKDAGAEIVLASPAGGAAPLDPKSETPDFQTDETRRFEADAEAMAALASTNKLAEMDQDGFDAIFYPGGHGPLWDLADNPDSIALIEAFWREGKPVAAVCHASAVLADVRTPEGEWLVQGREVAGFTNSEEAAVGLTEVVPFLLEDRLVARGAKFTQVGDFEPHTVQDGRLVTGQNPASSTGVAQKLLSLLAPVDA